ncbi:MAG: hypothetical protein V7K69_20030 [Nostoc sp.]|uniref:hypothetical protein n=1 Tax=Nostoc sp. TaxID=1180 RepID=UPI002FF4E081
MSIDKPLRIYAFGGCFCQLYLLYKLGDRTLDNGSDQLRTSTQTMSDRPLQY